jgi:thiosulfate dehydrogenase
MSKFLLGIAVGWVLLAAGIAVYFASGTAPVSTAAAPMPLEKRLAKLALHARLRKEMPAKAPFQMDDSNYLAGAHVYRQNCAICHGLPGQPATALSKGMFPIAPQLFVHTVTDDPPGETYWKAANGIRLSGMPGFRGSLSETQLWQVAMLLAHADQLPASARALLERPLPADLPLAVAVSDAKQGSAPASP